MEVIENSGAAAGRFSRWKANTSLAGYPFVSNVYAPFTTVKRALPMMNLALISSAGGYIAGTDAFDITTSDAAVKEIPIEVDAIDMKYSAKGFDPADVIADRNSQIPIDRLLEYQANAVLGRLNSPWWSISPWIPDPSIVVEKVAAQIVERLHRYEVQAALLVPASRLCHQTLGLVARAIEMSGIPTIMVAVDRSIIDSVRPPRTVYYDGKFGSVAGKPNWGQYQRRILDEALRLMETFDQPGSRKLIVDLETQVEAARGER